MISDMADEIVENNSELDWVEQGWVKYLAVFYKNECDMVDEIEAYVKKAAEEVFFAPMKTQFEWFFDEETMLEKDGDGSLIAVVGAFEGEEYNNVYNAVRKQWEIDTKTDLDRCCSMVNVDIEDMLYISDIDEDGMLRLENGVLYDCRSNVPKEIFKDTGLATFRIYKKGNFYKCYMQYESGVEYDFIIGIVKNEWITGG